jgi:hypothetical protein
MMPATLIAGGVLRIVVGAVPITILVVVFCLGMLVSLALPSARRSYVLRLAPIVVQLVHEIGTSSRPSTGRSSRN